LFHNCNVFGSCIIHILYTVCAKIKKNPAPSTRKGEEAELIDLKSTSKTWNYRKKKYNCSLV